jgi:hypothetical protein
MTDRSDAAYIVFVASRRGLSLLRTVALLSSDPETDRERSAVGLKAFELASERRAIATALQLTENESRRGYKSLYSQFRVPAFRPRVAVDRSGTFGVMKDALNRLNHDLASESVLLAEVRSLVCSVLRLAGIMDLVDEHPFLPSQAASMMQFLSASTVRRMVGEVEFGHDGLTRLPLAALACLRSSPRIGSGAVGLLGIDDPEEIYRLAVRFVLRCAKRK